ncbi:Serine_rich domain-containing protein [Meloidogyne graminicola]|uniref:Serine_rich domain-containing protein n=1 Tax=Meloidogyne graminicola TaxID=189291 RepID=A0A8T0A131_9BILA|nr:Serine_rich domain-containing protein [Meloidogyne graminicola]
MTEFKEKLQISVQKCLQERVCELFLMQDFNRKIENNNTCSFSTPPFFRSPPPLLQERISQGLYSNGADSLLPPINRLSGDNGREVNNVGGTGNGSVVRNIPIRMLSTPDNLSKPKEDLSLPNLERMETSHSKTNSSINNFTPLSSPDLKRHFASLFWTPQQAKRIAERENPSSLIKQQQKKENKQNEKTPINKNKYLQQQSFINSDFNKNNKHYSAIPFGRRKAGLLGGISAISTPSLFHQREDDDEPKSHYQNIEIINSNRINSEKQPPPRPPNPPFNNKLMQTSLNKSTTTFPINSNNIDETNVGKQNNNYYNNNKRNNIFPSQHSLKHSQTEFSTPNNDIISSNPTQQIRNRSVETTDLSSRNGGLKSFPLLPRRDSEPSIIFFAAAETPKSSEQKENQHSKLNISPSSPQSSTSFANNGTLERENRRDEKILRPVTTIASEDFSSLLSATPSLMSSSSCSASISPSPLASSSSNTSTLKNKNQQQSRQRIKSPSLAALRQSLLRYRPMRKNSSSSNKSENNNEEIQTTSKGNLEETKSLASTNSSNFSDSSNNKEKQNNYMSRSMTLTPSKLCLTKFTNSNKNNKESDKVDAVEEAIRSLEQFDPSEFVQYQYHQDNNENTQKQQLVAIEASTPQPKLYFAKAEQSVNLSQPYSCSITSSPNISERPSSLSSFSSLSSAIEDKQPLNLQPFVTVPSILHRGISTNTALSSSGSATPTQNAVFVLDEPTSSSFNFPLEDNSNDKQFGINSPTNTPRANSPTFNNENEINDANNKNRNNEQINNSEAPPLFVVEELLSMINFPPPDYSESGDDSADDLEDDIYNAEELPEDKIDDVLDSVTDSEEFCLNNKLIPTSPSSVEAKAQLRKRFLCSQLNDCVKVIEIGAFKMNQFMNASLELGGWRQPHILRHNLSAIRDTIYTVEIALDELDETVRRISLHRNDPRQTHLKLLFQPCEYSLTLLRRLRGSLDSMGWQLSALARPRGCVSGHDALDQIVALLPQNLKGTTDVMDGGESTSSTTSSIQTTLEQTQKQTKHEQQQKQQNEKLLDEKDNNNIVENTDLVLEEDDLASVLSLESNTTTEGGQQQNYLNGHNSPLHSPPFRLGNYVASRGLSSTLGICRINAELARSLAPEQRDLFRIWEPQVETHIETICTIIEQFFSLLEANKEPTSSGFQKIQMVYIEGHSLVGIGRVICRDDAVLKHRPLIAFLEHECSKLDSLLNECLADAKVAKSHSQNIQNNNKHSTSPQTVPAVRSMCKAIVSVSESVGHLRLFWKACCV